MADNWQITFGLADNHPAIYSAQPQFAEILNRQFFLYIQYYTTLYFRDFKFIIDGIESKVLLQNIRQGTATGR